MAGHTIETLPLDGGCLSFNFINTVSRWRPERTGEYLPDYQSFIKWLARQEEFDQSYISGLKEWYSSHSGSAAEVLTQLRTLRSFLYDFVSAFIAKKIVQEKDLNEYNSLINRTLAHYSAIVDEGKMKISLPFNPGDPENPLLHIIKSTMDVFENSDQQRIKECPECGWIFLDRTKNNKKVWCNPLFCGTTTKTRRYYLKKKSANQTSDKSE